MPHDHLFEAFLTLHRGLPRQGPGSRASTEKLLDLALGSRPADAAPVRTVLDLGSGPGASALVLAEKLPEAAVLAVDLHAPFLEELDERARQQGLSERVSTRHGDMTDLDFLSGPVDLIWCEAAVYTVGFEKALESWRPLLAPEGRVALTEIEWTSVPSAEAAKFWNLQYPLNNHERNAKLAEEAGFDVVGHFTLPEADWWDEYYTPLLQRLEAADSADPAMAEAGRSLREEVAVRQDYGEEYDYSGYVLSPR